MTWRDEINDAMPTAMRWRIEDKARGFKDQRGMVGKSDAQQDHLTAMGIAAQRRVAQWTGGESNEIDPDQPDVLFADGRPPLEVQATNPKYGLWNKPKFSMHERTVNVVAVDQETGEYMGHATIGELRVADIDYDAPIAPNRRLGYNALYHNLEALSHVDYSDLG